MYKSDDRSVVHSGRRPFVEAWRRWRSNLWMEYRERISVASTKSVRTHCDAKWNRTPIQIHHTRQCVLPIRTHSFFLIPCSHLHVELWLLTCMAASHTSLQSEVWESYSFLETKSCRHEIFKQNALICLCKCNEQNFHVIYERKTALCKLCKDEA